MSLTWGARRGEKAISFSNEQGRPILKLNPFGLFEQDPGPDTADTNWNLSLHYCLN